jgi:hypothetical protein
MMTLFPREDFHGVYQPRTRATRLQDSFLGFVDDSSSIPDTTSLSQASSIPETFAPPSSGKSSALTQAPGRVASRISVGVQVYSFDDA